MKTCPKDEPPIAMPAENSSPASSILSGTELTSGWVASRLSVRDAGMSFGGEGEGRMIHTSLSHPCPEPATGAKPATKGRPGHWGDIKTRRAQGLSCEGTGADKKARDAFASRAFTGKGDGGLGDGGVLLPPASVKT